jgi:glycosyltransferase involved in cell wall biosynthesis
MWDPVKGASILDQVASDLAVPFYAAGAVTGPHGESCALEHLHSLGELDRKALSKQLAARPIFVSAASFEPFGLAVLEAAGAGCALVLSDIPTFRELWDDAALFAPVGDPAAYRNAINWLLSDPWLRFSLGEAAAARAERYTPEATAKGMTEIYRTLLASPSKKGLIAA